MDFSSERITSHLTALSRLTEMNNFLWQSIGELIRLDVRFFPKGFTVQSIVSPIVDLLALSQGWIFV